MSNAVLFFKYESNEHCEKYKTLESEKKNQKKNMHTLFKDILIICFRSLCLISVLRLILTNDSRVDML